MAMFELQDHKGRALALAEAADTVDAELYGIREVSGFHRAAAVPTPTDHEAGLEADFRRMGLSESAAAIAARGRDPAPGPILPLHLHRVPRQEARPVRSQAAPASERVFTETTVRRAR